MFFVYWWCGEVVVVGLVVCEDVRVIVVGYEWGG